MNQCRKQKLKQIITIWIDFHLRFECWKNNSRLDEEFLSFFSIFPIHRIKYIHHFHFHYHVAFAPFDNKFELYPGSTKYIQLQFPQKTVVQSRNGNSFHLLVLPVHVWIDRQCFIFFPCFVSSFFFCFLILRLSQFIWLSCSQRNKFICFGFSVASLDVYLEPQKSRISSI